jgi:hypothetical protein
LDVPIGITTSNLNLMVIAGLVPAVQGSAFEIALAERWIPQQAWFVPAMTKRGARA